MSIVSGAIFALFVAILFLAFRPEWREIFSGVRYARLPVTERLVTVRITSEDEAINLTFEKVDWREVVPFMTALSDSNEAKEAKPIRERIRFWHVATIIALVGAIVVLVVSSNEQNQVGAWSVIGAVVGVWIKPTTPQD